ncbi:MAG: RdgB/HAM1 family non-canonical purine NTP pyrophosphatase [Lachnospiraceae bacterium]|jgi:XTP/dITP diphosphohydrolase|nr:RdgB/HAM1 family non-canonical purine NTP pyrophosphatase [Lachnospiraceae bacterium]
MNKRIVFATSNEGKMKEVRMILADLGMEILSMKQAGLQADIVEDGTTFEENARIKALAIQKLCRQQALSDENESGETIVLADDSGLEVDFLGGAPGIYSARYMGEETSYEVKNRAIIDKLSEAEGEERSARFVCAIAAALPDGEVLTARGTIEGQIGYEAAGEGGFGYDPIFYLPKRGLTTAQLLPEEKNEISHRGKALGAMKELLKGKLGDKR